MDGYGQGVITAQVTDDNDVPAYLITGPDTTYICRDESRTAFKLGDLVNFSSYRIESSTAFPHVHKGATDLSEHLGLPDVKGVVGEDGRTGIVCSIRSYAWDTWRTNFFHQTFNVDIPMTDKNAFIGTRVLLQEVHDNEKPTGDWKFVKIVAPPDSKRELKGFVFAEDLVNKQQTVFVPGMPRYFYFSLKPGINGGFGRWISFTINEHAVHNDHFVFSDKDVFQTAAPSKSLKETDFKIFMNCSRESKDSDVWTSTGDFVRVNCTVLENSTCSDRFEKVDLWVTITKAIAATVFLCVSKNQPQLADKQGPKSSPVSSSNGSEKSAQVRDTRSPLAPHVGSNRQPEPDHRRPRLPQWEQDQDYPVETRWVHRGPNNYPITPQSPHRYSNQAPRDAHHADHSPQQQHPRPTSSNSPNNYLPRRSPLRRSPPRRSPPRRSPPCRSPPRRSPPRRSPPRRSPPRHSPPRGSAPRGSAPRGSAPRGSPPRGSPLRRSPPRRSPPRGSPSRGSAPRGSPLRRSPPRRSPPRGSPSRGSAPRGSPLRRSPPRGSPPHRLDRSPLRNGHDPQRDRPITKPPRVDDDRTSSSRPARSPDRRPDNQSQARFSRSPQRNSGTIQSPYERVKKPPRVPDTDSISNGPSSPGNAVNPDDEIMDLKRKIDQLKMSLRHQEKYKAVYDMMKGVLRDSRFHNLVKSYNPDLLMKLQQAVNDAL